MTLYINDLNRYGQIVQQIDPNSKKRFPNRIRRGPSRDTVMILNLIEDTPKTFQEIAEVMAAEPHAIMRKLNSLFHYGKVTKTGKYPDCLYARNKENDWQRV